MNSIKRYILSHLTFCVSYQPERSDETIRRDEILTYKVIGHPSVWSWKTNDGNKVFTTRVRNRQRNFRCFRFDRIVSVKLAIW